MGGLAGRDAVPPRTGVLLLSRWANPGATVDVPLGPYDVLRSIEALLGLAPLAHAAQARSFVDAALPGARR